MPRQDAKWKNAKDTVFPNLILFLHNIDFDIILYMFGILSYICFFSITKLIQNNEILKE